MKRIFLTVVLAALAAGVIVAATGADAPKAGCCAKGAGVTRTVANLDNGVRITISGADAKTAAMLQEMAASCTKDQACCKDCPLLADGVTRTVERTANGVVITATATDAKLVKALQEHGGKSCAAAGAAGCCGRGKAAHAAAAHPASDSKVI
ncbi:MAG TPA: hypothetical protein VLW17_13045 [Thermoanaerobaculaceae bacterium]|nr:hypothetical protein [Thermoanaerobaculaceae bacterium]